ncbi:MAG: sensor histidine kinase [Dongiaceae bacterium]
MTCGAAVAIDREQFRQVIVNLLDNAAQAITDPGWVPPSGRQLTITLRTETAGPFVRLSVVDNGPGIPADRLPRIFEPLFTTKSFGVGLGLPTVRQIVEQHGGTIEATSAVDEGATLAICLPRLADAADRPGQIGSQAA